MKKYCIISYGYNPETVVNDSRLVGQLHISNKYENFDNLYRQILDFCYAKQALINIPNDIIFCCKDENLIKIVMDSLKYIFQTDVECKNNDFIDFWKERYIVANIEGIP